MNETEETKPSFIETLLPEEKQALLETLQQDLENRPKPVEFTEDFTAEMMKKALGQL